MIAGSPASFEIGADRRIGFDRDDACPGRQAAIDEHLAIVGADIDDMRPGMLLQQQMPGRQGGRIEIAVGLDQFLGATVQRVDMNPRAARRADTDRQRDGFFWRSAASAPVGQPKELFAQPAQSVVRFARLGFRVKPFDLGAIGTLLRGPCGLFQLHAPHAGGCGHQADRRIAGTQVAIPSHRMWPEMQVGFPVVHGPCRWAEAGRPKRHVHRELIPARVAHHVEGPGFKYGSDARRTMVADHHACPSWALLQYFGAAQRAVVELLENAGGVVRTFSRHLQELIQYRFPVGMRCDEEADCRISSSIRSEGGRFRITELSM
jgi:hypothetical protein